MSRFQIDQLSIHVSPASLLKCAIGLQLWYTRDVALQRPELAAFFEQVSRYVMQQPDDLPLPDLSAAVGAQLGKLRASHGSLPIADQFSQGVREILRSPQHRAAAERCAEEFADWLGNDLHFPMPLLMAYLRTGAELFGGIFLTQALFNVGCCGTSACGPTYPTKSRFDDTKDITYEEIK